MERGYVKLWRSIDQNELLDNDNTAFIVFMKLLTKVDRHTGSYKTGRFKLATMCNLRPSTLRDALKRLEAASVLRQQTDTKTTTIYICNWARYQQDDDSTPSARRRGNDTKQEREKEKNNTIMSKRQELLNVLNTVTGRSFRAYPDEKRTKLTHTTFSADEVREALQKMKQDDWHKPRMSQLSAGYLLSTENIDKFLNYKTAIGSSISGKVTPLDDRAQYKREFGK